MTFATFCSYLGCVFVGLAGLIVLVKIAIGHIDLSFLISEKVDGVSQASMSRFQLLIFTFVIAISFLTIIDKQKENKLPDIPPGVLTLLGISASTYAVGKGIQHSSDSRQLAAGNPPNPPRGGLGAAAPNVVGGNNPGAQPARPLVPGQPAEG